MRKLLVFVSISLATVSFIFAQEVKTQNEIGISFAGFNSIGFTYKVGKPNALWRINTLLVSGFNSEDVADTTKQIYKGGSFQVTLGREWRTSIDKIEIRYGADARFSYSHTERYNNTTGTFRDNERNSTQYSYGLNLVLGANYLFSESLYLGIELLPSFIINTGKSTTYNLYNGNYEEHDLSGISYGLNSTSALVTLGFRF